LSVGSKWPSVNVSLAAWVGSMKLIRRVVTVLCADVGELAEEVTYLIYGYTLAEAQHLAPSDRVELIYRETGVRVAAEQSHEIIRGLGGELYLAARHP
jgi:hypothetical protein